MQTAVLAAAQKKPSRDRKAQNIILKTLSSVGGYAYASAWIDRTPCIPHAGLRPKASAPTVFGMVPLGTENIVSCNSLRVKHFSYRVFSSSKTDILPKDPDLALSTPQVSSSDA